MASKPIVALIPLRECATRKMTVSGSASAGVALEVEERGVEGLKALPALVQEEAEILGSVHAVVLLSIPHRTKHETTVGPAGSDPGPGFPPPLLRFDYRRL